MFPALMDSEFERGGEELPPMIVPAEEGLFAEAKGPWGLWATIGWSFGIAVAYAFAQGAAVALYVVVSGVRLDRAAVRGVLEHGDVLAFATLGSAPVVVGLCVLVARMRRGISVREYFALRPVRVGTYVRWVGLFLLFIVGVNVLLTIVGGPVEQEFMRRIVETTGGWRVALWLAIVVAAPVSEEIFFRGFLLTGLWNSGLTGRAGVLITAGIFALIHTQYEWQGLLFIFSVGCFLGVARLRTGSLWVCMALHSFLNFVATLATLTLGGGDGGE